MAILTLPQNNSQHWYTADGVPFHQIAKADGSGARTTTLADARRLGLYCSVSELLGGFAKPGLIKWQIKKAIKAALSLTQKAGESETYFINRILEEANAEVKAAADFGTRLHDAMEQFFKPRNQGEPRPQIPLDLAVYCNPVIEWIEKKGFVFIEMETIIVNQRFGFAGTLDVAFCYGPGAELMPDLAKRRDYSGLEKLWKGGVGIGILDYKTRKTSAGVEVTAYDNQATQIVAYGATYFATLFGVPEADVVKRLYGANIFISSTEPGRYHVAPYTPVAFDLEWLKLIFVSAIWRLQNGHAPHDNASPLLLQDRQPTRALVRGITDIASADPLKLAYDVTAPKGDTSAVDVERIFASKANEKKEAAAAKRKAKAAEKKKAADAATVDAVIEVLEEIIEEEAPVEKLELVESKAEVVAELAEEIEAAENATPAPAPKRRKWTEAEDAFILDRAENSVTYPVKANVINDKLHEGAEIRSGNSYRQRERKLLKEAGVTE
tara:strand:- start:32675 stop:34162 length:1488 start_codon:yes stop_codon:yes gene_type:complete